MGAFVIYRPKELKKYSFLQKLNMSFNPFKSGRDVIKSEDFKALRWSRFFCLLVVWLVILRFVIAYSVYFIGLYRPDWL